MHKILVVDDDYDILTVVKLSLTVHGFIVEAIPRWEDIDDRISNFSPHLILLDVSLAGADGRDICKKLKTTAETQQIPIILFSANPDMGNNFQEYKAAAFIEKPYALSHLLQTVKAYLS